MTLVRRWTLGVVLLVSAGAFAVPAADEPRAEVAPTAVSLPAADGSFAGQGASVSQVGLRLLAIRAAVAAEVPRLQLWRWSWTATYIALTVGQLIPIPFLDASTRVDMWVGAASSAVGALLEALMPPDVVGHAPRYAEFPATAEGLADAERLLRLDADNEDFSRSWLFHAGNVLFNAAIGLVLGLGWKHWDSAAISFGVGVAVGEVMIITQPHMLSFVSAAGGPPPPPLTVAPFLVTGGGGLAFGGRF
jgi:hypothetical protein